MKKAFTLLAAALLAVGASAQQPASNAVGVYRTQTSSTTFSTLQTATFGGIEVSPIAGTTTSTVDLDNDENYGTSTATYRYRGTVVSTDDGKGRIYPITQCSEKDENSYIGVKLSFPAGKTYNIDRLLGQAMFGALFKWSVDIVKDGVVLYTTGTLRENDYKKATSYMDSISVTKDSISGLSEAAAAQAAKWMSKETFDEPMTPNKYILTDPTTGGNVWGNVLTDSVKGLSGDVELRLYYWGQYNRPLVVQNLYVELSEAVAPVVAENAVGVYRERTSATTFSALKTATFGGIEVSEIAGTTTSTVDLDNDENYGTSTATYRYVGTVVTTDDGKGRIYPITKCSDKDENSYIGVKLSIPEGKKYNIDRLLGQGMFGAGFHWCVDIVKDGEVLYTTGAVNVADYKHDYSYVDSVSVTKDSISGLREAAIELVKTWSGYKKAGDITPEHYALSNKYSGGDVWGNVLTKTVKDLSGDIELRFYYWGQKEAPLALHSLYVELSKDGTTGITQVATRKSVKSGIMYNLAGQRVDKSYKGIVIMDGKKFMNK